MELKFIGDRSGILGTIINPWEKLWAKNDKNRPKIDKNCAKIALFCIFSVFVLLTFFAGDGLITSWKSRGARAP